MPAPRPASLFDAPHGEVCAVPEGTGKEWAEAARAAGLATFLIDTRAVTTKDELLSVLGAALRFPDYFRRNWDAFEECFTDLSWVKGKRVLVHVGPLDALAKSDLATVETFVSIVQDAIATHGQHGRSLWVALASAKPLAGLRERKTPG